MRYKFLLFFIAACFCALIWRLWQLAIVQNELYEELALSNASKIQSIPPVRAPISDRRGELLAVNELGFSAHLAPHLAATELDKSAEQLADCFEISSDEIKKTYKKHNSFYNQNFIEVIDYVPYEDALRCFFALAQNPSVQLDAQVKRLYPYGALASHVIGYVGRANSSDMIDNPVAQITKRVGKTGIERFYNDRLQGVAGQKLFKVNSSGKELALLDITQPLNPSVLRLTIDIRLQKFLDQLFDGIAGAAIVMDVHSGEILAAGSYPEYDLNLFVRGISQREWQKLINDLNHPFTNKLINGKYPPGSIVKMGVGMSFLASGKMSAQTSTVCTGAIELGGRKFRCHNVWGHGRMNLRTALRSSCDDYFYKGSLLVGIDAISATLERLGFGRRTGVDLPLESPGILPNPLYKQTRWRKPWFQGETLNTSIGQGEFLVTPMQIAAYTAQLATGRSVRPRFTFEREAQSADVLLPAERAALPAVRAGMKAVANDPKGTAARHIEGIAVPVAAKTGTAQVVGISQSEKQRIQEEHMEHFTRSHAWINAYAPLANPQVAIAIIVEHGMHGGATAGPLLREVVNELAALGYLNSKEK